MSPPDLPAPLVPPDCDLRDFPFMPLDVVRLRDSDFACRATDAAFRAGVMLWLASWHQVPAGSLPDDDCVLSMLAQFGRVVRVWKRHREGALHGWVKCSDGRLYHPVVAEKAREAWRSKQERHHQRLCDRLRKENGRRAAKGLSEIEIPALDAWMAAGRPADWQGFSSAVPPEKSSFPTEQSAQSPEQPPYPEETRPADETIPPETADPSGGNPTENALKGQGQGEEKGAVVGEREPTPVSLTCQVGRKVIDLMGRADDPRWTGNFGRVGQWLADGADPDLDIYPTVTRLMAQRKGDPPGSLKYFDRAIADSIATRTMPLPEGAPRHVAGNQPRHPRRSYDPDESRRRTLAAFPDLVGGDFGGAA